MGEVEEERKEVEEVQEADSELEYGTRVLLEERPTDRDR